MGTETEIQRHLIVTHDGIDDRLRVPVNATQSLYSGVVLPPPGDMTVLSSAIWHGTVLAGRALSEKIGDFSAFLMRELHWSKEELNKSLAPAQIDAAVMIIHGLMNKDRRAHDFLLSDEAGFGKGRVLMTVALWCRRNGILPIVLTKTSSLFSNLWQDAIDIGATADFKRPFIVNERISIVSLNGQGTIFGNISPKLHRNTIRNKEDIPDEFGIVMLTWSQLASKNNPKLDWILDLGKNRKIMTIGDECHTAVSRSALIAQSAAEIRRESIGSCDTSATSARHIMNMASYRNIYPWLAELPLHTMETMPTMHQAWLAELSVQQAIGNGKMIRREIDRSGVTIDILQPDDDAIAQNYVVSDHFAAILSEMRSLWLQTKQYVSTINVIAESKAEEAGKILPKSARLAVAGNFYNRLETISLQFDACVSAEKTIEVACGQLLDGIQPSIILNMTMESAASQLMSIDLNGGDDTEPTVSSSDDDDEDVIEIDLANRPLTFPDILRLMLDNTVSVVMNRQKSRLDLSKQNMQQMRDRYEHILEMIEAMPGDMPASPIDYIRDGIEAKGKELFRQGKIPWAWKVGEISGRSAKLIDGRYVRRNETTNEVIIEYNNGTVDSVIMTAAGSTGGSMHHTAGPTPESNARRRPHSQIEVVGSRDPVERIQTRGRIARRGVISTPRYAILLSGTPYSQCRLAVETAKEKMLNASVSGSHRAGVDDTEINMLSAAGDAIARDMLVANPDLADHLGIDLVYADPSDETWHVRRLMGRSMMLSCADAINVMSRFKAGMQREARHVRNISVSQIGSGWSFSDHMTLLEPGDTSAHPQSIWNADTGIASISRVVPVSGKIQSELPPLSPDGPDLKIVKTRAENALIGHLESVRPSWAKSVKHALSVVNKPGLFPSIKRNPCVIENERYHRFLNIVSKLKIGEAFILPDAMGENRPAILVNIVIPSNPLQWRKYSLDYIVPGDKTVYVTDLMPFIEPESIYIADNAKARSRFPQSLDATRTETLFILQGNMPRAILHASRAGVGRKVEFVDDQDRAYSGIVLTKKERQAILAAPLFVPSTDCAKKLMEKGVDLFCANSLTIRQNSMGMTIQVDTKGRNGKLDVILAGIAGCKANSPTFNIPLNETGQALDAVGYFYSIACSSRCRKTITQIMDGMQMRDTAPSAHMPETNIIPVRGSVGTIPPASRAMPPRPSPAVSAPNTMPSRQTPSANTSREAPKRSIAAMAGNKAPSSPPQPQPPRPPTATIIPPRTHGGNNFVRPNAPTRVVAQPRPQQPARATQPSASPPVTKPTISPRLPPVRSGAAIARHTQPDKSASSSAPQSPSEQMKFQF